MGEAVRYVKIVAVVTVTLEGLGAVFLTLRFAQDMAWGQAFYSGIFHSISAFNNAGFALFSDSLISYQADISINLIVTILIVLGSIGFFVFQDAWDNFTGRRFRFQTHTKLVVVVTLVLLVSGTLAVSYTHLTLPTILRV